MQYKFIHFSVEQRVATITLARSDKRNAFTPTMVNEIAHAIARINSSMEIHVVLFRAEGPVFCAGMDLKTFEDPTLDVPNAAIANKDLSLGEVMRSLLRPSIAIVEGDVIAGGFLLVLGCTYVFAKENVRFRLPELNLGIFPFQVAQSLLRIMPEKQMLQLCLETDYFDIHRASKLNIVDGLLEEKVLSEKIRFFQDVAVNALAAGISAIRELEDVESKERYTFLKDKLEALKNVNRTD